MATSSVAYNKPVLPRVSDTSDLASNRASVYSGKALDFDGVNDKIDSDFSFVGTQATISFYLSWDSYGTDNVEFILEGNASSNFMVHLGGGAGTNGIRFAMTSAVFDNSNSILPGYNHYTLTTNNNTASLYVNGKLFRTQSVSLGTANTPYLGIGYRRNSPSYYLNGRLSGLKVFDAALTATQVAELYNNPEQILPTGVSAVNLKLWLPMMEGAGSYVYNGAAGSLGEELVSNGGFDEVCQKWGITDNGYATITNGKVVWNAPNGSGANVVQYLSGIQAGKTYRVSFDYSVNRDGFGVQLGDYTGAVTSTNTGTGRFTTDITVGNANGGYFLLNMSAGTGDLVGYMDNVSVKEVVPQATGTISGATWVSGLPEPLPQTALMDWNKGTNAILDSKNMSTSYSTTYRGLTQLSVSEESPIGTPGAVLVQENNTDSNPAILFGTGLSDTGSFTLKCWLKADRNTSIAFATNGGTNLANINVTTEWQEFSVTQATSNGLTVHIAGFGTITQGSGLRLWVWHPYLYKGTGYQPYIETSSVAQYPDLVLVPEGNTSNKDIFGNSIAVPRSSGAFNFDGKSWVQFQNNNSLEISGAITLEFWAKWNARDVTPNYDHAIGRRDSSDANWLRIYRASNNAILLEGYNGTSISGATTTDGTWYHVVATLSGTDAVLYINGTAYNSGSLTWNVVNEGAPWTIGTWINSTTPVSNSYTFGDIANPRIYNYALTANQVADNFNQKASTFGKTKVTGELQAYINRTFAAGATVEAHSALLNTLTELENK